MKTKNVHFKLLGIALTIMLASCACVKQKSKDPIKTYKNSGHNTPVSEAKKLYINYKDRFRSSIEEIQKGEIKRENDIYKPTEYVLVNIDDLKCYLDLLEKVEQKNRDSDKKITALAIFIGARGENARIETQKGFLNENAREEALSGNYRNDTLSPINSRDIRGRITVFMAPTYRSKSNSITSESERHIPFYIKPDNEEDPYKGNYLSLLNYFKGNLDVQKRINTQTTINSKNTQDDDEGITTLILEELTDMPPKKSGI